MIKIVHETNSSVYVCESYVIKHVKTGKGKRARCYVMTEVDYSRKGNYGVTTTHYRTATIPCKGRRVIEDEG